MRSTSQNHLPEHRRDLAERSPVVWRERAAVLGGDVAAWVDEQLEGDVAVSALRRVQKAVLFLESLPDGRADAVCRRARAYGLTRVTELRNVVTRCLDRIDLPDASTPPAPGLPATPMFARAIGEMFLRHQEARRGWE